MKLRTIQAFVAVGLICAGVALLSVPAALITGGVLLLVDRIT